MGGMMETESTIKGSKMRRQIDARGEWHKGISWLGEVGCR